MVCTKRKEKTYYMIEYKGSAYFEVTKHNPDGTKKTYTIDAKEQTCGCQHYWIHKTACKHILKLKEE